MQPFWLVRRLTDSALKALKEKGKDKRLKFNATITEQEFQSMCMGAWHDESVSLVYKVVVPVLTNTVSLQVNDELILQKAESKEPESKARTEDWKTSIARREQETRATAAKAKAKAKADIIDL